MYAFYISDVWIHLYCRPAAVVPAASKPKEVEAPGQPKLVLLLFVQFFV